jgi:hypothetical protein
MQLQLLYQCDHNVIERTIDTGSAVVTKSDTLNIDQLRPTLNNVLGIDKLEYTDADGNAVEVSPEIYNLYNDTIVWQRSYNISYTGRYRIPAPGETYKIYFKFMKATLTKYTLEECTRCNGTGWYLNPIQEGSNLNTISGPLLVAQDFIKMLLTTPGDDRLSPSYGTAIFPEVGINYFDKGIESYVAASISAAEFKCRNAQVLETWRTADDILDKATIKDIATDIDTGVLAVSVELTTQAGTHVSFDVNI